MGISKSSPDRWGERDIEIKAFFGTGLTLGGLLPAPLFLTEAVSTLDAPLPSTIDVSPLENAGDVSLQSSHRDLRDTAEPERPAGTGISQIRAKDGEQVGRTLGKELDPVLLPTA